MSRSFFAASLLRPQTSDRDSTAMDKLIKAFVR